MQDNYGSIMLLAIKAAIKAGAEILEVYNYADFGIENKTDNSPITIADKRAHNLINSLLETTGIKVLSEEGQKIPYDERKQWEQFWLVDPLDGTKEFINRNGEFTVNIALINDRFPVAGVIYVPVTGELYYGILGSGAFKIENIPAQSANQIGWPFTEALDSFSKNFGAVSLPLPKTDRKYTVLASRSHLNDKTLSFIETLEKEKGDLETLSRGSSLKFCMVAEGKADIYPRFGPTMEWDTAAGQAIVLAAGGTVFRDDINSPLEYNKENLLNPYFIVKAKYN